MKVNQNKNRVIPKLSLIAFVALIAVVKTFSQNVIADESEHISLVQKFIKAFNQQQTKQMLELVDDEIQWISINGETTSVETKGIASLEKSMEGYFKNCPSCRSTLEWIQASDERVITLERAEWMSKNGLKKQKSVAVYEFRKNKILRVYYLPAEKLRAM